MRKVSCAISRPSWRAFSPPTRRMRTATATAESPTCLTASRPSRTAWNPGRSPRRRRRRCRRGRGWISTYPPHLPTWFSKWKTSLGWIWQTRGITHWHINTEYSPTNTGSVGSYWKQFHYIFQYDTNSSYNIHLNSSIVTLGLRGCCA